MNRFASRALGLRLPVVLSFAALVGCASNGKTLPQPASPNVVNDGAKVADAPPPAGDNGEPVKDKPGPWIGAAGASDFVMAGVSDTSLGVWVDVPQSLAKVHTPAAVALVVDTSGSMAGAKIENARAAARELISKLSDGDIVAIETFSDEAKERVAPTVLSPTTRPAILRAVASLEPSGGTNMFDGLRLAEGRVLGSPASHPVRRVILISDGQANVGPSSPDVLGSLASRGADSGVQVTSIGVGLDYDENTLNALAVRSSGRLYHLTDPKEMTSMLDGEVKLLQGTSATNAFVEIIPAPGVQILGADGVRADATGSGGIRVPLGTMFGGQHREMLVRIRVNATTAGEHPLASVRLHFSDPSESNLDRVQEVVARYQMTSDVVAIDEHANARTRSIAAVQEAARATIAAAQQVNTGNFAEADRELEKQEAKLRDIAAKTKDKDAQARAVAAVSHVQQARKMAKAAEAAPPAAAPAAKRASALDMNQKGMLDAGY